MKTKGDIKNYIKDRYGRMAAARESCCPSCSCSADMIDRIKAMGYSPEEIGSLPEETLMGLGCGNPTALAELAEGETVLDLGCGGGLDVFLAASRVGPTGKAIGIDMTQEMIAKAEENAQKGRFHNVEFHLVEIEHLPLEDDSIDVIISNCVINLAVDKSTVFKEAYRVLRHGGRMLISDVVIEGDLPEDVRKSSEAWAACIAGALEKQEYLEIIRTAGFRNVTVVAERTYDKPGTDPRLAGKITSLQVRALK